MNVFNLPESMPYDPAADSPGNIDLLDKVASAEQLAEVLLPGLTARMWRTRLLTFNAVAAIVIWRAVHGSEDRLQDAVQPNALVTTACIEVGVRLSAGGSWTLSSLAKKMLKVRIQSRQTKKKVTMRTHGSKSRL